MNREQSRIYVDRRAKAWRWWPEGLAKLAGWVLFFVVLSTMVLPTMPQIERPSAVPEHATIGLFAGLLAIVLRLLLPALQRRGRHLADEGEVEMSRKGDSPGRWLHYRMRRTLLSSAGWLVVTGLLMSAASPIAIRLWDTGFDLASLGMPVAWLGALMGVLHWIFAMLLLAALTVEAGFLVWRQFWLRDGALLRALPFGVLWQRLAAHEHYLRERMPSRHMGNWPRGRTL